MGTRYTLLISLLQLPLLSTKFGGWAIVEKSANQFPAFSPLVNDPTHPYNRYIRDNFEAPHHQALYRALDCIRMVLVVFTHPKTSGTPTLVPSTVSARPAVTTTTTLQPRPNKRKLSDQR